VGKETENFRSKHAGRELLILTRVPEFTAMGMLSFLDNTADEPPKAYNTQLSTSSTSLSLFGIGTIHTTANEHRAGGDHP
jgi:hypothetical protein